MSAYKRDLAKYFNCVAWSDIESVGFYQDVKSLEDIHTICSIVDDPDTGEEVVLVFHDRPDLCGSEVFDKYDNKTYKIPTNWCCITSKKISIMRANIGRHLRICIWC